MHLCVHAVVTKRISAIKNSIYPLPTDLILIKSVVLFFNSFFLRKLEGTTDSGHNKRTRTDNSTYFGNGRRRLIMGEMGCATLAGTAQKTTVETYSHWFTGHSQ